MVKRRKRSRRLVASVTASSLNFQRSTGTSRGRSSYANAPQTVTAQKEARTGERDAWFRQTVPPWMELVGSGSEAEVPGVMRAVVVGTGDGVELSLSPSRTVHDKTRRLAAQGPAVLPCQDMDSGKGSQACQGAKALVDQPIRQPLEIQRDGRYFFLNHSGAMSSPLLVVSLRGPDIFGDTMLLRGSSLSNWVCRAHF